MEYSIQEVARAAGTTSRTLRHYDSIGLLRPSRVGPNGYRYYDNASILRLQRVLLLRQLGPDWTAAAQRGEDPASPAARELAGRQVDWLRAMPGTPAHDTDGDLVGYLLGLGELYVSDGRFAANYGGPEGATFVRDALRHYVESELS
ncbi:MerR family transcriptional regulator [Leucobacter weissii]|uniref:MerR family transcriptional regulator n=1 Tax=Leucobacter weissii TaxID=1983706 RepID=A0A939MJA3_9MICO|nr:MerR family transcriptional regulator [Leucobacter weissii]MBO1901280.1 MerR family transcriptional regulator [Leucobacter weissii]